MATPERERIESLSNQLEPIGHLNSVNLEVLLDEVNREVLPPRSLMVADDEGEWLSYIVKGEVILISGGSVKESVSSGSQRALEPLFNDDDKVDRAITELGASVIQFKKTLFETLYQQEQSAAATELVEIDLSEAENLIFEKISKAFASNTLELPNFPDVALKIRQAIDTPDIGISEVSQIVQADPVLAGRLMQVANSPLYRGVNEVQSVRDAISRMGLESTRSLTISLAVKQLFKANSSMVKNRMKSLYQQSTFFSAISYVLAHHGSTLDPERALFAGLIHDIGVIPILTYVDSHPDIASTAEVLEKAIENLKAPVGAIVVSAWNFDHELVELVEAGDDWSRDNRGAVDYTDLVLAARWYGLADTGFADKLPDKASVPAIAKLGLDINAGEESDFLEEARDEIAVVQQILQV